MTEQEILKELELLEDKYKHKNKEFNIDYQIDKRFLESELKELCGK
jgi:hypothetical protein